MVSSAVCTAVDMDVVDLQFLFECLLPSWAQAAYKVDNEDEDYQGYDDDHGDGPPWESRGAQTRGTDCIAICRTIATVTLDI